LSANHSNSKARFPKVRIRAKLSKIDIGLTRPYWLRHFITRSDFVCGQLATLQTIQSSCTRLKVGVWVEEIQSFRALGYAGTGRVSA